MEEIDLKELMEMFWIKKVQILLIVLIFMVIGFIYTVGFTTPMYSSSTTLILASNSKEGEKNPSTQTQTEININQKLVSTYSQVVKSKSVLRKVKENLKIDIDEETLRKNIKVNAVEDTEIIEITVNSLLPENSAKIANEIAKVFTEKVKEIYNIENVQVLDKAEVSEEPSNIHHSKDVVIFAFVGVVLAVMYVLIINMLDTTIKTAEEVEKEFKIPVIASIPIYEVTDTKSRKKKGGRR